MYNQNKRMCLKGKSKGMYGKSNTKGNRPVKGKRKY